MWRLLPWMLMISSKELQMKCSHVDSHAWRACFLYLGAVFLRAIKYIIMSN